MNEFIQSLKRHTLPSVLNLLGLAAALAACYILTTQIQFATRYNKSIPEWENVYRMEANGTGAPKTSAHVCRPLAEMISEKVGVEEMFLGFFGSNESPCKVGDKLINLQTSEVDRRGLRLFRPKMICGVDSLPSNDQVLMPRSIAEKLFGRIDVAGESLTIGTWKTSVAGVYEDFPDNCCVPNHIFTPLGDKDAQNAGQWNYNVFYRLALGVKGEEVIEKFVDEYIKMVVGQMGDQVDVEKEREWFDKLEMTMRPIGETYFSGIDSEDKGNAGMLMILRIASALLLIVAAINFANFTLAETPMKIKGINTKKVLGMTNFQLRRDFILETVAVAAVAFVLSLVAIFLLGLSPWFLELLQGSIAILDNLYIIIYIGAGALAIGALVGVYPAWFATSFQPAMVLKGSFGLTPRGVMLRKTLVGVQLCVAILLTFYLGVLFLQKDYLHSSDYGFAKDEILYCNNWVSKDKFESVRAELEAIPGVDCVGFSLSIPGTNDQYMTWGRGNEDQKLSFVCLPCDWKFPQVLGLEIVEGRPFAEQDKDVFIVNETIRKFHDWVRIDQPLAEQCEPVAGVFRNIQVYSKRQDNSAAELAFIIFGPKYDGWKSQYKVAARVGGNVDKLALKKQLEETLARIAPQEGIPAPEFRFFDEQLQQSYEEEFRFISQVEAFSIICLVVTLVGVFCLTMFETEYRRREIGLRRVMGTSRRGILRRFIAAQLVLLIPAFLLAAPLAWLMSQDWLNNFAERATIPLWLPLAALAIIATLVLATVATMTWRALRLKPVEAIKTE